MEVNDRVLHFAPEPYVSKLILNAGVMDYHSADLRAGSAEIQVNIEDTGLPDASYDVVFASHVLEHVNDRKALHELHRILRPGGSAVVMVPVIEGWDETHEDPRVTSPYHRLREFGQEDHVRYYGRDFRERVQAAGFRLEEHMGAPEQCSKYALLRGERVFICHKASGVA